MHPVEERKLTSCHKPANSFFGKSKGKEMEMMSGWGVICMEECGCQHLMMAAFSLM